MPDAPHTDHVTAYLEGAMGSPLSWSPAEVQDAMYAEMAAQARVCNVPDGAYSQHPDLYEALKRRVARNLAARPAPLGFIPGMGETGEGGAFIGMRDPEVRRLEAPHRKLVIG